MKNILVINKYNEVLDSFAQKVINHLESLNCNVEIYNEKETYTNKDLAVVIGGDGTMLGAARNIGVNGIPLIGINTGRIGFLTDISKDSVFEKLSECISGQYVTEKRDVLSIKLYNKNELIEENIAINDFFVYCSNARKLIEISLFINDEFVYNQYVDGLIVATATGSSAYSLSAGGSIVNPNIPIFNIVPVSAQNLSIRPLIISNNDKIKLLVSNKEKISYTNDGLDAKEISNNSFFIIEKHVRDFELYPPKDYSYYGNIRNKLNW